MKQRATQLRFLTQSLSPQLRVISRQSAAPLHAAARKSSTSHTQPPPHSIRLPIKPKWRILTQQDPSSGECRFDRAGSRGERACDRLLRHRA